jgi:hypothetical protein
MRGVGFGIFVRGLLLLLLFAGGSLNAQTNASQGPLGLTLDALLERLELNMRDYDASVPNLYCSEHMRSQMGSQSMSVVRVTESMFRLRRHDGPDAAGRLEESRVVNRVDGRAIQSDAQVWEPALLYGAFGDGLKIVSVEGKECFRYKLKTRHRPDRYVVEFSSLRAEDRGPRCPAFQKDSGRVFVDPESLHVVRIEQRFPDHLLTAGTMGVWKWSTDFAPVTLLGRQFWLPKTMKANAFSDNHLQEWSFDAVYSNYHLFHADVTILPAGSK